MASFSEFTYSNRTNLQDPSPDPAFHLNAEPDPTFHFIADPDSVSPQSDAYLRTRSTDPPGLHLVPPHLHCEPSPALHGSILCLLSDFDADPAPSADPGPDPLPLIYTVHIFADRDCNTLVTLTANPFFRKILYYFCLIMDHASD